MKPDGALHNLIEGYHHTWQDSGKTGQRFLLAGFFYAIRVIAYSVAFPLFAKEKGFSSSQIGVLIAVGAFSLLLTGLPVTRYAVRGHTRQLLLAAPVLSVIGLAILITAPAGNFALFVIGAALANSVSTVFWVLGDAILAAVVASEKRASVYALKFAVVTVGFALGGGLGGWIPGLLELIGFDKTTALAGALVFLGILDACQLIAYRSIPAEKLQLLKTQGSDTRKSRAKITGKAVWIVLFALVVPEIGMAFGHNAIRPFLSLFFDEEFNMSTGTTGTAIALMMLTGGIGALVFPSVAQRWGNVNVVVVVRVICAIALMFVATAINLPVVLTALLIYFALIDGTEALIIAEMMDKVRAGDRTHLSGLLAMSWSAASGIGSIASGYLQDREGGFTAAFGLGLMGYLFSAAWCGLVYPRIKPIPE